MIDSFLKPNGRRSLMFFYQEVEHDGSGKLHTVHLHVPASCKVPLTYALWLFLLR